MTMASTQTKSQPLLYHSGFGNEFASEAVPGALPVGQNNPQQARAAVDDLLSTARQLEMRRLPDLSAGAMARTSRSASD